jgi:hypothetical protein
MVFVAVTECFRSADSGEIVPQRSECDLRHELSAPVIREI